MTAAKPVRKPSRFTGVDGLKAAISATALAITVGGWGVLTVQNSPEVAVSTPNIVVDSPSIERQPLPQWLAQSPAIPVLPTIVPLQMPDQNTVAGVSVETSPTAVSSPAVSAPVAPALREVTIPNPAPVAPPAPVARTRSSR